MRDNINEDILNEVVGNCIRNFINEQKGDGLKLYTQLTRLDKRYIDSVFSDGLKCRDNDEADGIWFSLGNKFYGHLRTFCFSLPYDEESMKVGGFDEFDWGNEASILVAHKNIPISYLKLEEAPLYAFRNKDGGEWRYSFKDCSAASERFVGPETFRGFDKNKDYVIFRDMYEYLFGHGVDETEYEGISNVSFDEFLFNNKWMF